MTVTITLLGGFGATVDGEPVADNAWRLRKARDLVKLLALAPGRRLHREQVMDALWRERDPGAAANNLYQAVHAARRAVGAETIVVREELLSLVAETDVDEFERAAAEARRHATPASYRAALAVYSGELLPENRYEDWAADRREVLARLHAELSDELAALGAVDGLHSLPVDASSFVGRGHELGELTSLLAGTRLLTLAGTGGVGKTRLALELARGAASSYEAGAVLVELAAVDDPGLVVNAVATALDVRALPDQMLVDAVVDFLAPRALLVVLDNCEHVLATSAALADTLLRAAPRLAIVATSREPLRIPGEVVFRVPSLAIPDPDRQLPTDDLLRYEAVRLFVERATAAEPGFALDDENALDVARICVRLDGLPLALELAAGRVGTLGPASVAARLDDRFRLFRAGSHAAPTRQQTLEATLQWSHDLLEWDERLLLRRLAVFAGSFELSAVEAVCMGDGLDVRDCADVLARLVEKSLVAVDARDANAATACSRPCGCTRATDWTKRARRLRSQTGTRGGRSLSRSAKATRRGSTSRPRTFARRSTRCSRTSPPTRCGSPSRSGRSGCAGSTCRRRDAAWPTRSRLRPSRRRCARTACSRRRRSTSEPARSRSAGRSRRRA